MMDRKVNQSTASLQSISVKEESIPNPAFVAVENQSLDVDSDAWDSESVCVDPLALVAVVDDDSWDTQVKSEAVFHPPETSPCKGAERTVTSRKKTRGRPRTVSGGVFHPCGACPRVCTSSAELRVHERVHSGERPFQCPTCCRSFSQKGNLRMHVLTHSLHRPFPCQQCEKSFVRARDLQRHSLIHVTVKSHTCSDCKRTYTQETSLARHRGGQPGVCPQVRSHFAATLTACIALAGPWPFSCECGARLASREDLRKHVAAHAMERNV